MFKRFWFNEEESLIEEIAREKFSLRKIFNIFKVSAMFTADPSEMD